MKYQQIYADALLHCKQSPPPEPWSRFAGGEKTWHMPLGGEPMLDALREKYASKSLVRSGIAVRIDHRLHPNPVLLNLPEIIVPLRELPGGQPFDFITEQGTTRGRLPLRSAVLDHHVSNGIGECGYLFVTIGIQDLIRLRLLGMPVAPALGLEEFHEQSMQDFRYALGLCEKKPPKSPHQLILVDWSPEKFSARRNELVDQIIENFTANRSCLGIALQNILVWRPTSLDVRAIANGLRIGQLSDVVQIIQGSLEQSCTPLASDSAESSSQASLLECERRLNNVLLRPDSSRSRRRRSIRAYRQSIEAAIVKPLLSRATEVQDLNEKNRLMGLAELCRLLYPATATHRARFEKELVERGLSGDGEALDLRGLLKGFDTLGKLLREPD